MCHSFTPTIVPTPKQLWKVCSTCSWHGDSSLTFHCFSSQANIAVKRAFEAPHIDRNLLTGGTSAGFHQQKPRYQQWLTFKSKKQVSIRTVFERYSDIQAVLKSCYHFNSSSSLSGHYWKCLHLVSNNRIPWWIIWK